MKALLSYSLLAAGLCCAATAVFIVVGAEAHQSSLVRRWTEPDFNPSLPDGAYPPGAVARLRFVRQHRDVFIWGDEDPGDAAKGPVWLHLTRGFDSPGNTVIAGHRDTHFRFLKDAKVGDVFEVDHDTARFSFRISSIQIVFPTDRALLAPTTGKTVTLVTCYPFYAVGRANRRMIIRADLL